MGTESGEEEVTGSGQDGHDSRGTSPCSQLQSHGPLPCVIRLWSTDATASIQDLEEVEEWNEYGELKDHVGGPSAQTSTPTPSAMNTPSKAPSAPSASTHTPSKPPPSPLSSTPKQNLSTSVGTPPPRPPPQTATDSPLTTAMRQAGFEAAKKAGDAKKAKLFAAREPETLEGKGEKNETVDEEALKKLDSAGPVGMPPPSGTTEAEDAKKPETAGAEVDSKADDTPTTEDATAENTGSADQESETAKTAGNIDNLRDEGTDLPLRVKDKSAEVEHPHGTMEPLNTATGQKTEKGEGQPQTKGLEEDGGLKGAVKKRDEEELEEDEEDEETDEEEDDEEQTPGTKVLSAATKQAEALPGKKTQDQEAAKGEEVGVSVGD